MLKKIWPWVWEFPQMFLGVVFYVVFYAFSRPVATFADVKIRQFKRLDLGSMACGRFIFISASCKVSDNAGFYSILEHEYGHIIQSKLVGPWLLIAIGIPSFLRACWFQVFNLRHSLYESAIFEYTATQLGSYSGIRYYVRRQLQDKNNGF